MKIATFAKTKKMTIIITVECMHDLRRQVQQEGNGNLCHPIRWPWQHAVVFPSCNWCLCMGPISLLLDLTTPRCIYLPCFLFSAVLNHIYHGLPVQATI